MWIERPLYTLAQGVPRFEVDILSGEVFLPLPPSTSDRRVADAGFPLQARYSSFGVFKDSPRTKTSIYARYVRETCEHCECSRHRRCQVLVLRHTSQESQRFIVSLGLSVLVTLRFDCALRQAAPLTRRPPATRSDDRDRGTACLILRLHAKNQASSFTIHASHLDASHYYQDDRKALGGLRSARTSRPLVGANFEPFM